MCIQHILVHFGWFYSLFWYKESNEYTLGETKSLFHAQTDILLSPGRNGEMFGDEGQSPV